MCMIPTAAMDSDKLIFETLRRRPPFFVGRGSRCIRNVASALALIVDVKTGVAKTTLEQIGAQCNYSTKWVSKGLQQLEKLGLISWSRGGVWLGRTYPSVIRVSKKAWALLARTCWDFLYGNIEKGLKALSVLRGFKTKADEMPSQSMRNKVPGFPFIRGKPQHRPQGRGAVLGDSIRETEIIESYRIEILEDPPTYRPPKSGVDVKAYRQRIKQLINQQKMNE